MSGFVWETLEQPPEHTMTLVRDEQLLARIGEAARRRAARFSRESFINSFMWFLLQTHGAPEYGRADLNELFRHCAVGTPSIGALGLALYDSGSFTCRLFEE